ncbi:Glycosyltransferase involved in cell wall bisynthesis [Alkalibacterium subtropicum]|uniref:Glycosyltransferase involved in cell wall bisynthesis n=1 Tax=Alkalibacterium subtropicum TaxID=753702 RepID=A0A1I1GE54_9LACT|nr:glycosyltransferase [Alkalibacterium subtropicum]SFC09814.1 Glycosyltransferase involved in cell wall bisynthesis [Alkalibacterium subtropicum]
MSEVLVSIVCNAYNHEAYIAQAIESFLKQKTNFNFEILINDDASTDNTAEIIRAYESQSPDIINAMYQTENQHSKGVRICGINESRAVGKYIALCEGDDYWTDPYKLQKQVDFLENNEDVSLCVHGATIIEGRTDKPLYKVRPADRSKYFSTEDIIFGGGGLFPTNSMVYRREDSVVRPAFYYSSFVGDYPLTIFLSLVGKVYYLDEIMSTYRYAVPGSWTEREYLNSERRINHYKAMERMLAGVNDYTDNAYASVIRKTILKDKIYLHLEQKRLNELAEKDLNDFYNELKEKKEIYGFYKGLSKKEKLMIHLNRFSPNSLKVLVKIRRAFS